MILHRDLLYGHMHTLVKSIAKEMLFKFYMRVYYFLEMGIRGIIKNEDIQQHPR